MRDRGRAAQLFQLLSRAAEHRRGIRAEDEPFDTGEKAAPHGIGL